MSPSAPTFCLVLGAGGDFGTAFIRASLRELRDDCGFRAGDATRIIGTSAGAYASAHLGDERSEPTPETMAALTARANGEEWTAAPLDVVLARIRRVGARLVALAMPMRGEAPTWNVADAPYHPATDVVTVSLRAGRRVLHRLGDVRDPQAAVRASGAVPLRTHPVLIGNRYHVDGAVHSPTNADLIAPDDVDVLVVIAPMARRQPESIWQRLHRSLLRDELRPWLRAEKPVVVFAP